MSPQEHLWRAGARFWTVGYRDGVLGVVHVRARHPAWQECLGDWVAVLNIDHEVRVGAREAGWFWVGVDDLRRERGDAERDAAVLALGC